MVLKAGQLSPKKEPTVTDFVKRLAVAALVSSAMGLGLTGCEVDDTTGDEDDLTSNTALARNLQFEGYVYVSPNASDSQILAEVKRQNKSAFGALRNAQIGVN